MQKSLPYFLNRVAKTRSEKEAGRKKFRWMCHPPRGARTEPCALSLSSQFPFVLLTLRRPSFSPSPLRPPPFPLPLPSLPLSLLSPSQGEGSARARRNGPMDKQPPPRRRRKWDPRGSAASQPRRHLSPSSPPPLPLCARCRARPAAGAAPRSRKDSAMQPDGRGVARPAHGRSGTVPAPPAVGGQRAAPPPGMEGPAVRRRRRKPAEPECSACRGRGPAPSSLGGRRGPWRGLAVKRASSAVSSLRCGCPASPGGQRKAAHGAKPRTICSTAASGRLAGSSFRLQSLDQTAGAQRHELAQKRGGVRRDLPEYGISS